MVDEEKHRFEVMPQIDENGNIMFDEEGNALEYKEWQPVRTEPELKEHKNNTVLRSRITAKWDIPKCKVNPLYPPSFTAAWTNGESLRNCAHALVQATR